MEYFILWHQQILDEEEGWQTWTLKSTSASVRAFTSWAVCWKCTLSSAVPWTTMNCRPLKLAAFVETLAFWRRKLVSLKLNLHQTAMWSNAHNLAFPFWSCIKFVELTNNKYIRHQKKSLIVSCQDYLWSITTGKLCKVILVATYALDKFKFSSKRKNSIVTWLNLLLHDTASSELMDTYSVSSIIIIGTIQPHVPLCIHRICSGKEIVRISQWRMKII